MMAAAGAAKAMQTSVPPLGRAATDVDAVSAMIVGRPRPRPGLSLRGRNPIPPSATVTTSSLSRSSVET
jgi:hypothetical protein